jgi:hypothetical protein
MRGWGYSEPTRLIKASTEFSPQYPAANSAGIRRGQEPDGIEGMRIIDSPKIELEAGEQMPGGQKLRLCNYSSSTPTIKTRIKVLYYDNPRVIAPKRGIDLNRYCGIV